MKIGSTFQTVIPLECWPFLPAPAYKRPRAPYKSTRPDKRYRPTAIQPMLQVLVLCSGGFYVVVFVLWNFPFNSLPALIISEPVRVGAIFNPSIGVNARDRSARRQAKGMDRHLHAARVAIANFDIAVDHHGFADKAHRAHADGIAQFFKLVFQFGNLRVRVPVANNAQTGGTFAKHHASILATAQGQCR